MKSSSYCCILAVHSAVHVSPHSQSESVSDEAWSMSNSSHVRGCTWNQNKCNRTHSAQCFCNHSTCSLWQKIF